MLKEREAVVRASLIFVDALVVSLAYLFAFYLRKNIGLEFSASGLPAFSQVAVDPNLTLNVYLGFLLVAAPLWCWMLYVNGMYRSMRTLTYAKVFWIACKAAFMTSLGFGTFLFLIRTTAVSRLFFSLFAGTSLVLILAEKTVAFLAAHYIRRRGRNYRRLLIVGTGRRAADFVRKIKGHPEWGFQILGAIDDEPGRGIKKVDGVDIIGTLDDIPRILHNEAVDEIVFVVPRSRLSHVEGALHD
jgi:FlaA1/EpsC-like NDP-sugar epimerase